MGEAVNNFLCQADLFSHIEINGNRYTPIHRVGNWTLVLTSLQGKRMPFLALRSPGSIPCSVSDVNRVPRTIYDYRYIGVTDLSKNYTYFLAVPYLSDEEKDDDQLNVHDTLLALFVGHLEICEDYMSYWPTCLSKERVEKAGSK